MQKADYIILGAGASGLQLAYRMSLDAFFADKSIMIIDKDVDKGNDRTWCFWEKGEGEWDDILYKTWDTIYFGSEWFSKEVKISPYSYKMIRSQEYYKKLWQTIDHNPNIQFQKAEVIDILDSNDGVTVKTTSANFEANQCFNSLPLSSSYKKQTKYPVLQQHFIGWFIKTDSPQFNDMQATFMDFDIPQRGNTRFMYILPTSSTEALFEYTLFSKDLLPKSEYEDAIKDYLKQKRIKNYKIIEKESGSIPMTSYKFFKENKRNILNIGTAGGWTKASTGYTFANTSKKTKQLVDFLKTSADLSNFKKPSKFWYYDLLMLDVLADHNETGAKLFSSLFKKSKVETIFKFLDEETSFTEDLKIMSSVPRLQFSKAMFRRLF